VAGNYPLGDNGPAARALVFGPKGVAVDRAGHVYVADERNSRVRKITPQGTIATLARARGMDVAVDPAGENAYVLSPEFAGDLPSGLPLFFLRPRWRCLRSAGMGLP